MDKLNNPKIMFQVSDLLAIFEPDNLRAFLRIKLNNFLERILEPGYPESRYTLSTGAFPGVIHNRVRAIRHAELWRCTFCEGSAGVERAVAVISSLE